MRGDHSLGGGLFSAVLIALGVLGAGWLLAGGVIQSEVVERRLVVDGSAERLVTADLAVWDLEVRVDSPTSLQAGSQALEAAVTRVLTFLTLSGADDKFDASEVTRLRHSIERTGDGSTITALTQVLRVRSSDAERLAARSRALSQMLAEGVSVSTVAGPAYFYRGAGALEGELRAQALTNAREAAEAAASAADLSIEGVQDVEFSQIDVSDRDTLPGASPASQVLKRAVVEVRVTFLFDR